MESNAELIRDLTETLLTKYFQNDTSQTLELASAKQFSNAVKAAVRSFKDVTLIIQLYKKK